MISLIITIKPPECERVVTITNHVIITTIKLIKPTESKG